MKEIITKKCVKCGVEKQITDYYVYKKKGTLHAECKECSLNYTKYRQKNNDATSYTKKYRELEKIKMVVAYGGKCSCCGESRIEFLAIDHAKGDGAKKRKNGEPFGWHLARKLRKLGYPKGDYRVLCHNCNSALGIFGYCPHNSTSKFEENLSSDINWQESLFDTQ
jgi:hypothetical protein